MATNFSITEALSSLSESIPDWNARLAELNGQIANRQIELARLTEKDRPPTRSLKNKGSTESLRPKDGEESPCGPNVAENVANLEMNPIESPTSHENGSAALRPSSSAAARQAAMGSPPPPKANSGPRPSPGGGLTRQSSQPTPQTQHRSSPAAIRKRKTESLASAESLVPKYRTRSMIIVYYDSAVQTAFEDLVKFVSGSRNAMRKGKMAAKMAEMRRAAEMEVDAEEDEDDEGGSDSLLKTHGTLLAARKEVIVDKQAQSSKPGSTVAADSGAEGGAGLAKAEVYVNEAHGSFRYA